VNRGPNNQKYIKAHRKPFLRKILELIYALQSGSGVYRKRYIKLVKHNCKFEDYLTGTARRLFTPF
jgi:hypothetical protein